MTWALGDGGSVLLGIQTATAIRPRARQNRVLRSVRIGDPDGEGMKGARWMAKRGLFSLCAKDTRVREGSGAMSCVSTGGPTGRTFKFSPARMNLSARALHEEAKRNIREHAFAIPHVYYFISDT